MMWHERNQRGMTLVELIIGLAVSVLVMGGVVAVQTTASEGFSSSMNEQRLTGVVREGMSDVKTELRSALVSSIVIPQAGGNGDGPVLTFQHAVGFDAANGTTQWGGGQVIDGTVEYAIQGTTLLRRVRDDQNNLVPGEDRVLFEGLDPNPPAGKTVDVFFDVGTRVVSFAVRVAIDSGGHTLRRSASTVIHIHEVFAF